MDIADKKTNYTVIKNSKLWLVIYSLRNIDAKCQLPIFSIDAF